MCSLAINIASFAHILKRVDFVAIVDHLAELNTTRIGRYLEVSHSYSFNLYYIKGKDMILSDFLSRQEQDDSDPHKIIPILFNMQTILQSRYCNTSEREEGKYLVQTRLQAKSSGIALPEVHCIDKGIDPNIRPEKQVIKPIISSGAKRISQITPRLGQGRAGIKRKNFKISSVNLINQNNHRYYQVDGPSYK